MGQLPLAFLEDILNADRFMFVKLEIIHDHVSVSSDSCKHCGSVGRLVNPKNKKLNETQSHISFDCQFDPYPSDVAHSRSQIVRERWVPVDSSHLVSPSNK